MKGSLTSMTWCNSNELHLIACLLDGLDATNYIVLCFTVIWLVLNIDNLILYCVFLVSESPFAVKGHFYSQLPHSNLSMFIPYLYKRIAWPCYTWGFSNFLQDGSQLNFAALFACCQLSLNYMMPQSSGWQIMLDASSPQ